MKIRKGDTVVVISGKDKGKVGTVLRLLPGKNRVVVSDVNMRTKHIRKTAQNAGQIVKYEASIHISNVMMLDPKTKKRARIGFAIKEGKKTRVARQSGTELKNVQKTTAKKAEIKKESGETEKKIKEKKTPAGRKEEIKKEVKTEERKVPAKTPFWRSFLGGGKPAEGEGEVEGQISSKDHSVADQTASSRTRSSQRGS